MSEVVSFINYQPPSRYDLAPWTNVLIEESDAITGTYAQIDDIALSPLDTDPAAPQLRSFTTSLGTAPNLWYQVRFQDGNAGLSLYTAPVQNVPGPIYATVAELQRILRIRTPSADQSVAMARVLSIAASEINSELDLSTGTTLNGFGLDICAQVNIDRAADLWRHTESAPGVMGVVDEFQNSTPGRYSWARYVARLSTLKDQWGIA